MKNKILIGLVALVVAGNASADFADEVTSDAIFGNGGNANGSFTIERSGSVELGLRGKLRHDATGQPQNTFNWDGVDTYSFAAGVAPFQAAPTAVWSFEWSINTDYLGNTGVNLDGLTYELGLDFDPSQGQNFETFDPIHGINPNPLINAVAWDHSIGDNSTGPSAGTEATGVDLPSYAADYADLLANYNLAQNSWKAHWYFDNFDPTVNATYDIYLAAFDGSGEIARTSIQIVVGTGGDPAVVPVPAAAPLGLLGMGLVAFVRRRKNAKAQA